MVLYTLKVVFENLCVCSDYRKEYPLVAFNITVWTTEHFRKFQWIIHVSYNNKKNIWIHSDIPYYQENDLNRKPMKALGALMLELQNGVWKNIRYLILYLSL